MSVPAASLPAHGAHVWLQSLLRVGLHHFAVRYLPEQPTFMVILDLGTPPGFAVMGDDLEALRAQGLITKFDVTGRQVTLYVGEMSRDKPLSFSYKLRARFPVRAKTPRSVAYEYYTPDSRGVQEPQLLTVVER